MTPAEKAKIIANANDRFRKAIPFASPAIGKFLMTATVSAHPKLTEIVELIRSFNGFTAENDPYQEHDFGSVKVGQETFFWKIDYYDTNYKFGAEDPSMECRRVLTIMYAHEY